MNGLLVIGQYSPGDSLVHRLDPRVKIMALLLLAISVLIASDSFDYWVIISFLALSLAFSKVHFISLLTGLKWLWLFFIVMLGIQIFTIPGETLFIMGPLTASKEGFVQARTIFMIIFVMLVGALLLVATTSPFKLAAALENILSPLNRLGVPVNDIALMVTVAVRFIPVIAMEYEAISKAQRSRGMALTGRGFVAGLGGLVSLIVPLFTNSIRRAEELATAMECRGYGLDANVTRLASLKMVARDYIVLAVCMAMVISVYIL